MSGGTATGAGLVNTVGGALRTDTVALALPEALAVLVKTRVWSPSVAVLDALRLNVMDVDDVEILLIVRPAAEVVTLAPART